MTDHIPHPATSTTVTLLREPAQAPDCSPSQAVEAYLRNVRAEARKHSPRTKDGVPLALDTLWTDIEFSKEHQGSYRWVYDEEKQTPILRVIVCVDHRDLSSIRSQLAYYARSAPDQVVFVVRTFEEEKLAWCRKLRNTIRECGDEAVIVND